MKKVIKDIGIIGIGKMGRAMAQRGLDLGDSIRVWNRRDTPMLSHIVTQGALRANSLPELLSHTNNIILTLADDHAITEIVQNIEAALVSGLEQGVLNYKELEEKCFIDCSSTCPNLTRRIATTLKTKYGVAWIDAPVSGGPLSAVKGRLAMMVGGNQAAVTKVKDILLMFAPSIHYIGESGAGQKAKLCNQIILSCFFLAVAESVRFAEAVFENTAHLADELNQGHARSRFVEVFAPRMIDRNYTEALGSISILLKSLRHINALSLQDDVLPLVNQMQNFFEDVEKAGHEDKEPSLFVDFLSQKSKAERRSVSTIAPEHLNKLCTDIVVSSLVLAITEAMKLAAICGVDFNLSEAFENGFADSELLQSIDKWRKGKGAATLATVGGLTNSIKEIREIAQQLKLTQPFFECIENYFQTMISPDYTDRNLAELVDILAESSRSHFRASQP